MRKQSGKADMLKNLHRQKAICTTIRFPENAFDLRSQVFAGQAQPGTGWLTIAVPQLNFQWRAGVNTAPDPPGQCGNYLNKVPAMPHMGIPEGNNLWGGFNTGHMQRELGDIPAYLQLRPQFQPVVQVQFFPAHVPGGHGISHPAPRA